MQQQGNAQPPASGSAFYKATRTKPGPTQMLAKPLDYSMACHTI